MHRSNDPKRRNKLIAEYLPNLFSLTLDIIFNFLSFPSFPLNIVLTKARADCVCECNRPAASVRGYALISSLCSLLN